jgi:MATE family multidrug resistance protein
MGLNGAIDTLVSQAFGKKKYYLCGCLLNRGRLIQALFFIPELIILLFTREFLLLLGQEEASAESARLYIYTLLPGMFAMTQFETVRRYLQAMKVFYITMYIQAATMILHCVWCYLLVFNYDLGVTGASIATCITYWLNLILITVYVTYKSGVVEPISWHFPNKDSFVGWGEYLKYGVPAALMLCLEWWSFEIMALFAGMLSINELAANVVLFNLVAFLFQFAFGMSFAVSNLVGNSLGQDKPKKARKYFVTSLMAIVGMTVILMVLLLCLRWYIPLIYTQQEEVVALCAETIPYFIIMIFFDYFQSVASGSVRAIGYQKYGSIVSLIGYWFLSIPAAYLFAFTLDLRLIGIWLGVPIGTLVASFSYAIILFSIDWEKVALECNDRLKESLREPLLEKEID